MQTTQKLLLSIAAVFIVPGTVCHCRAATIHLVIPNPGFEDQGGSIDGDGDGNPLATDPADWARTRVPGWFRDGTAAYQNIGIFNPSGAGVLGFTTTTAHSGNLVLHVSDENNAHVPIRSTDGAAWLLGVGDVFTVSGWIVEGMGAGTDIRFALASLSTDPLFPFGYSEVDSQHVRDVVGSAWQPFTLTFTVGAEHAAHSGIPLAFSFNSESSMLLDDLSISVERVPEPSTSGLAAAALLGLQRRRRKFHPQR